MSRAAVVLLVGLAEPARAALNAALAALEVECLTAPGLDEALPMLWARPVSSVLVGTRVMDRGRDDAREAAAELRRAAPAAMLLAVDEAGEVSPDALADWDVDDVLRPEDLQPGIIRRVVRAARAVARANDRLVRWALRDPLTNVLNRRGSSVCSSARRRCWSAGAGLWSRC